jgi:VWFA-related protein
VSSVVARSCVASVWLVVVGLHGATPRAAQSQPSLPTFRTNTQLVLTTVVVRDKDGNAIEGLAAKDFVVTEDGEPQDIAFVEYQRLADEAPLPPLSSLQSAASPSAAAAAAGSASDLPSLVQGTIGVPPAGDARFHNRRLIMLFFDLSEPPGPSQERMFAGALTYLDHQMTPADLIAILTYSGGAVRVKQDFTDDRATLAGVIDVLANGEDKDGDGQPDFDDVSSPFGQDDAEFNVFGTDRKLAALQTAVTLLRPLPEQKALVFFTSNLSLSGTDNNAQMRATTNAAIRANVQIFPVDARGLVARAPLGNAEQRSPGGAGMFTGALAQQATTRFQQSQDTLFALAKDTGGQALVDDNDLSAGVRRAAAAQTSYYILGFYSSHTNKDGKFRRVQVRLADSTREADVTYRPGYYADKEWAKQNGVERERQLEDALMLENPITDITIALELNYFQINRAEYFVPIAAKVPGGELELARRRGAPRMTLDFLLEVKDAYGATQRNMRDRMEIPLTDANAGRLATHPIQYQTGFTLLPGKYVIKFLVRDAEVGRIGTYQTTLTIPNLNREEARLPISTVVLGSQRVPVNAALYSVKTMDKQSVGDPLIDGGEKLLPSVTRVFSASRDLYVYLEAYEHGAAAAEQPLVAFAAFYRDGVKVLETAPVAVTDGIDRTSRAVPIRFSMPLASLPPGRYDCQVTVIEPDGRKAAFWRAPIAVVP